MHTIHRTGDGQYSVGYYLVSSDGGSQEWFNLFSKLSFGSAMMVVSSLNGGGSLNVDFVKTLEKCQ